MEKSENGILAGERNIPGERWLREGPSQEESRKPKEKGDA